jgi:hypothetical protein
MVSLAAELGSSARANKAASTAEYLCAAIGRRRYAVCAGYCKQTHAVSRPGGGVTVAVVLIVVLSASATTPRRRCLIAIVEVRALAKDRRDVQPREQSGHNRGCNPGHRPDHERRASVIRCTVHSLSLDLLVLESEETFASGSATGSMVAFSIRPDHLPSPPRR